MSCNDIGDEDMKVLLNRITYAKSQGVAFIEVLEMNGEQVRSLASEGYMIHKCKKCWKIDWSDFKC